MHEFLRLAKGMLRYPFSLTSSIICSLMVAVLWSGNIGALYPLMEVCLRGQSVQQWVADDIASEEHKLAELESELRAAPNREDSSEVAQHAALMDQRDSLERSIHFKQWISPSLSVLPESPFQTVLIMSGLLLCITALKNLFIVGNLVSTSWTVQRTTVDIQDEYMQRVITLDMRNYHQLGTSQLVTHFTESLEHVSRAMYVLLGATVREPLKMISCGIGAAMISWRLMAFTLLTAPIAALLISTISRRIRRTLKAHVSDSIHLNRLVLESVTALPVVQAYGMEKNVLAELHASGRERMRRAVKTAFLIALTKPVSELAGILAVTISLCIGAHMVLNQQTDVLGMQMMNQPPSISVLLVFVGMLIGMSDPARKMTDIYSNLQVGFAAAERVLEVIRVPRTIVDPDDPASIEPCHGQIEFDQVNFRYGDDADVLRGIDLRIGAGETICIVGHNGCGKSTLSKLLLRFYDPGKGAIRLDGVDLRDLSIEALRSKIAYVPQRAVLVDESVASNIRFGKPEATMDEVIEAARQARADQFIRSTLPDGYETTVGYDGQRLSGGQQQRIALARAMIRDPSIMILDEATSQIDPESERLIHEALEDYARERTCIIVSHQPAVLKLADRVVVMHEGNIASVGTQQELEQSCHHFQRLFKPTPKSRGDVDGPFDATTENRAA